MNKTNILGVGVDALKKNEVLARISAVLTAPSKNNEIIATTYSEFVVAAQTDEEFKNILNNSFLNLADGIGVLWAASFLNRQTRDFFGTTREFVLSLWQTAFDQEKIRDVIPERISGADLIWDILAKASENHNSVYFLGSYGDITKPVLERFPGLRIAGRDESSYLDPDLVTRINSSGADVLLAAFHPVMQYKWLSRNRSKLIVKLSAGLGGTFDYLTGRRERAGEFWQKHGLEWLYRLLTQPWRLRRMWNAVVVFSSLVFRAKLRNKL